MRKLRHRLARALLNLAVRVMLLKYVRATR